MPVRWVVSPIVIVGGCRDPKVMHIIDPGRPAREVPNNSERFLFTASSATNLLTAPGHPFAEDEKVFVLSRSEPFPLEDGETYFVRSLSGNDFRVSLTLAGSLIDLATDGVGQVMNFIMKGRNYSHSSLFDLPNNRVVSFVRGVDLSTLDADGEVINLLERDYEDEDDLLNSTPKLDGWKQGRINSSINRLQNTFGVDMTGIDGDTPFHEWLDRILAAIDNPVPGGHSRKMFARKLTT